MRRHLRSLTHVAAVVALAGATVAVPVAEAKLGGGGSMGSRGGRTWSAPAATPTAPRATQPMQRSETPNLGPQRAGPATAAGQSRGLGFGGGLVAGLLGAGLIGMLFGGGFLSGLSGLASFMGLLMQVALVGGLVWLALRFFRRRQEPAMAGAGGGGTYGRSALGGMPSGGMPSGGMPSGGGAAASPVRAAPVTIGPSDYEAFERSLVGAQDAYGREDTAALGRLSTPEMLRYFEGDLAENARRGVRNEVSGAKLLQGDLSEAWREGTAEYATVAMRFTLLDVDRDRATGRIVSGHPDVPQQSVEAWTFRRDAGGTWLISAIQQSS